MIKRKKPTEAVPEDSPLAVRQPRVTRFNRKTILVLAMVLSSVVAFVLVGSLSPKPKASGATGNSVETGAKSTDTVTPPDPLMAMPGRYEELGNATPSRATLASGRGAATDDLARGGTGTPGVQPPPGTSSVPLEQRRAQELDRRLQDAASATSSPVTFNNDAGPKSEPGRNDSPVPAGITIPGLDRIAGALNREGPPQDDQNLQGEKRSFVGEKAATEFPYVKATLLAPLSKFEIKAGSILPALLVTGINSDLPGQLVAQIRENVYDTVSGNHLLVPQGTRLIGEYDSKIAFGQERVLIVWTRLIMPNGKSINLEGMPGVDLSGYAGVTDRVNNHYGRLITGVVLGSVIGAGAQVAVGGQGTALNATSFGQLATSGAAANINSAAQQYTQKNLNMQPTIEIAPASKINVFATKDMILEPYRE